MPQPVETQVCVFVDPTQKFQTLIGIGGALTDAAAETFYKLPKAQQQEIIRAYYDTVNGIGYTWARTNINSCDFSSDNYVYIKDGDKDLTTFDISHDRKYKIPLIKEAIKATNGKLKMFVSPWSPPAWMKDNNSMFHGGKLRPQYMQSWANYYAKFIKTYEAEECQSGLYRYRTNRWQSRLGNPVITRQKMREILLKLSWANLS